MALVACGNGIYKISGGLVEVMVGNIVLAYGDIDVIVLCSLVFLGVVEVVRLCGG